MPVPDLLRQDVDEADAVIDRALVHRIGGEEAVDVVGAQVGDHLGRRHGADLHVGVGVDAGLCQVIAQQVVVHRVVEGHRELEALPVLRIAPVLVLHRQGDGLAVDVLHRRHRVGLRVRAEAERDRDRHRRQHVSGVVFLVQRLVADHRPAGGLHHLNVQALLLVEAHGLGHDDRRGAGDRDEADLQIGLLRFARLRESLGGELGREELAHGRERRGGPDTAQEGAAFGVVREERPHHRAVDGALQGGLPRGRGCALGVMRGLARMGAAGAAAAGEAAFRVEGVVEQGHLRLARFVTGADWQGVCQPGNSEKILFC
ncbi:hypothetical protein MET9862_05470 [Methylobacterium symbioticum]|uniref:Uncharacterized protein n=1 Tax=Methylobacterium symbioticum TaxID=2584084 RepID=A0A509EKE4_9HYPH|nr:hypothetical protein MET9862_05470 [Methylobacterium symbioticum]